MDLQEILSQPEGFTPPSVTVKIEKVFPYKSGESDKGAWSFQSVKVDGGELKLKNLDEFPADRVGETVTLKAFQSKQHGLTGMKVAHEEYQGKTYNKLVITPTCLWEWANGKTHPNGNGASALPATQTRVEPRTVRDEINLESHLAECARIANSLAESLHLEDDSARQACFATVCIDAQRHNVILGDSKPSDAPPKPQDDARKEALLKGVRSACKLLNDEGFEPPFTPVTLKEYVNENFEVTNGLDGLSYEQTEELIQMMAEKLDNFRLNKSIGDERLDEDDDTPF
jgi:hypothetical protein